jgi:hypothetical protein
LSEFSHHYGFTETVAVFVIVEFPNGVARVAVAVIVTVFAVDCGAVVVAVTNFVSCPAVN